MQFFLWLILVLLLALIFWVILGFLLDYRSRASTFRRKFLTGRTPEIPPSGFYEGNAYVIVKWRTPWLGKTFDVGSGRGWNFFTPTGANILRVVSPFYRGFEDTPSKAKRAFAFETFAAQGLKDSEKQVMLLDYGLAENPFPINMLACELVEVGDREYLGVIYFPFLPKWWVTVGYFALRK